MPPRLSEPLLASWLTAGHCPHRPLATVSAGYESVWPVARQIDLQAILETVVIELGRDEAGIIVPREFRYSFRGRADRLEAAHSPDPCSFDILLDPRASLLAVTAMDREFEQADDEAEWLELIAAMPAQLSVRLGPWLNDLDTVLPTALKALNADAGDNEPDSASLYIDEDGNAYGKSSPGPPTINPCMSPLMREPVRSSSAAVADPAQRRAPVVIPCRLNQTCSQDHGSFTEEPKSRWKVFPHLSSHWPSWRSFWYFWASSRCRRAWNTLSSGLAVTPKP